MTIPVTNTFKRLDKLGVLKVLLLAVEFAVKAVEFYCQTDQGKAEAEALFAQLEAEGLDFPFWEPDQSGDTTPATAAVVKAMTAINAKGGK